MKNALKKILCCGIACISLLGTAAAANPFTDVSEGDWFYKDAMGAYEQGLMSGVSATSFAPNNNITRGMIVTMLHRLEGTPDVSAACSFADVNVQMYYYVPIVWAAEHGIVNGYTETAFGPNDAITREQMAAILYRYANMKKYDVAARAELGTFTDADKISGYAVENLSWANAKGLISGMTATTLEPQRNASRAQAAAILMRFCSNVATAAQSRTVTVTFELNFTGAKTYKTLQTEKGAVAEEPTAPRREGYTFQGWYTAPSGGTRYSFGTAVTNDLVLYARWVKKSASGGGGTVSAPTKEETVQIGSAVDAGTVAGTEENLFLVSAASAADGKTVTVTVTLGGAVNLCGFDMKLRYNQSLFALREMDEEQDLQVFAAANEAKGEISFNYANATNIKKKKTVMVAVFDVIGASGKEDAFALAATEVIATDAQSAYTVEEAAHTVTYTKVKIK